MEIVNKEKEMITNKGLILLLDLFFLRYEKLGRQWYELTDYIRDKLANDGIKISYDDKNGDILFGLHSPVHSVKDLIRKVEKNEKFNFSSLRV